MVCWPMFYLRLCLDKPSHRAFTGWPVLPARLGPIGISSSSRTVTLAIMRCLDLAQTLRQNIEAAFWDRTNRFEPNQE